MLAPHRPVFVLIVAMLIFAAQVRLQRSEAGDEASAIGALRAIATAQLAYASDNGGYATRLKTLAAPCPTQQRGFISPDLAGDPSVKSSYEIRLETEPGARPGPADCNGVQTSRSYYASAAPLRRAGRVIRAFAVDQRGVIWYDTSGVPPKPPFNEIGTIRRFR